MNFHGQHGRMPLHKASEKAFPYLVKALCEARADPDGRDQFGCLNDEIRYTDQLNRHEPLRVSGSFVCPSLGIMSGSSSFEANTVQYGNAQRRHITRAVLSNQPQAGHVAYLTAKVRHHCICWPSLVLGTKRYQHQDVVRLSRCCFNMVLMFMP